MSEQMKLADALKDFEAVYARIPGITSTKETAWHCYLAALATQPQAPQGAGWQTVETAPKDGTHVLLGRFPEVTTGLMHAGLCAVDWWRQHKDAAGFTGWGKFNAQYWPPTHWMPLPPPPTETPEVQK